MGAVPVCIHLKADDVLEVEVLAGHALAGSGWPSVASGGEWRLHAFQAREFIETWMSTIGRAKRAVCRLVIVRTRAGRPVLLLPLAIEHQFGLRVLRFMDGGVADYNAPVLAAGIGIGGAAFASVWQAILTALPPVDVIDLQKMPPDVDGACNPLALLGCEPYVSSGHVIRLADWPHTSDRARSIAKMRKHLRRRSRRLAEIGPVRPLVNLVDPDAVAAVGDRLFALKRGMYARTIGRDYFAVDGIGDFYRKMMVPGRIGRISHLSALTCGGRIISAQLGFVRQGRFYCVLPAYDADFRAYSPGKLLLDHLITASAADGYDTFDLGEGDHPYKAELETDRLPLLSYERARSAAGHAFLQLRRARRLARWDALARQYARARNLARHLGLDGRWKPLAGFVPLVDALPWC